MRNRQDSKLAQMGIIDRYFPGSPPGIVRCFQMLIALCALIAVQSNGSCWYSFHTRFRVVTSVTIAAFLLALIIYTLFLYRVNNWLSKFMNVTLTLLVADAIIAFLFFMSSVLCFTAECELSRPNAAVKLTAIFGLMGILGFSATVYMEYCWYKNSIATSEETNTET
ncbi:uncharacterized protein LOC111625225 [Centruroides sculpturatus]|uniref:uncharacterized protein LOC111625225 n=1 Tax=Centruroides sculpturatus TaxID=218467 RepID=UPI000C6CF611|nr:uncharacterized protein LOC111625225 [Centruroides sculpturatus]